MNKHMVVIVLGAETFGVLVGLGIGHLLGWW